MEVKDLREKPFEGLRDGRILEDRFHQLFYRDVGFELFDPDRAYLLPKKTYAALSGKYVLLGFSDQAEADRFFDAVMRLAHDIDTRTAVKRDAKATPCQHS